MLTFLLLGCYGKPTDRICQSPLRRFDEAIASFVDGSFNRHFFEVCYGAQAVDANTSHEISHMHRRYSALLSRCPNPILRPGVINTLDRVTLET